MKFIVLPCLVFSIVLNQYQVSAQINFTTAASTEPATAIVNNLKCDIQKDRVSLEWMISNNELVSQIEVQSSRDGKNYSMAALVFSTEKKDNDVYYYYEKAKKGKLFYRLKILHKDQTIRYSAIVSPE
jgi:hypothetical protein